jgi:penicillin-binding protein 1C
VRTAIHRAVLTTALLLAATLLALGLATAPKPIALPTAAGFDSSEAWLLDRNGHELARLRMAREQRRLQWVPLSEVSPAFTQALLAAEDQRYDAHNGVDFIAIAAAMKDAMLGRGLRGASTLTMQLAAQLDSGLQAQRGRRSLLQKLTQMRAALTLERKYSKAQLLEAYLNTVTFRGELQGIASASQALFNKAPHGLDTRESALLVALLRAPQARANVLAARACTVMRAQALPGCDGLPVLAALITQRRSHALHSEPIAHHAARRLLREPAERLKSSLDAHIQRFAQRALHEQLHELWMRNVEDGAVVVLDNASGEVLAYVGSSGALSQAAQVDTADALRQAGSTLKPFVYALALESRRITAASLLHDAPLAIQTADAQYLPRNYSKDFKGWVSARAALAGSLNVPAVRLGAMLEPDGLVQSLRDIGLTSLTHNGDHYGASLALGSADVRLLELTNAYRTLANGGLHSAPTFTPKRSHEPQRVLSAEASAIVADMLADNEARSITFGLDSPLRLPFWAAVKTGTSKDMRDNWCIGFTSRYTVGVWVGNASGEPMHDVSGVHGAAPVWHDVMRELHRHEPAQLPALPAQLVRQHITLEGVAEPPRHELFIAGTQLQRVQLSARDTLAALGRPRITQPLDGAVFALDPDIPLARQSLVLEREGRAAQWWLDGKPLEHTAGSASAARTSWTLRPGAHVLRLQGEAGETLDEVRFEVRTPILKAKKLGYSL